MFCGGITTAPMDKYYHIFLFNMELQPVASSGGGTGRTRVETAVETRVLTDLGEAVSGQRDYPLEIGQGAGIKIGKREG